MKLHLFTKILFVLLLSLFFGQVNFAQKPTSPEQTQTQAEPAENSDQLPFMQNEQPAEYAEPGTGTLLLKTFGAMILIVGLIFAGARVLKKLGYGPIKSKIAEDTPELAILSSVSPGTGQTLSIVRFGERTLLVGSTTHTFTLLAEKTEKQTKPEPRSVADMLADENHSFGERFEKAQENLTISANDGGRIC